MPRFGDLTEQKRSQIKEEASIEAIYHCVADKINNYGVPAKVNLDEIIISSSFFGKNKVTEPCVTLRPENDKYLRFCISLKRQYGITEINLYSYGKSSMLILRNSNNGNNEYVTKTYWRRKWEDEFRYYEAISRIYGELFSNDNTEEYKFDI